MVTSKDSYIIPEKTCPQCGKKFIPAPEHAFFIKQNHAKRYFCKYTCMCHYRDEQKEKRKYKKRGM